MEKCLHKKFRYNWGEDIYILHLQLDNESRNNYELIINRIGSNKMISQSKENICSESYRVMVSRSSPEEKELEVLYPNNMKLIVYELDDRAYFPTETFFEG